MTDEPSEERRHSIPDDAVVLGDEHLRAEQEAANGVRQFDLAMQIAENAIALQGQFKLRPSTILTLHREALMGLSGLAGSWRPAGVRIEGSTHQPADAYLVPELIEGLCDYVNEQHERSAIHLAAYVMWRLNWIHPFTDGNGRTSRIVSYMVLCIKLGSILRGRNTIPDQIVYNRKPYFDALEKADEAFKCGAIDVSDMEELLQGMLAVQLKSMIEQATNKSF